MVLAIPTVKDRILLHLFDYRRFREEFEVPLAITQEGIAKAVWIDIRHVVQYTRPHLEEGFMEERSAHIRGGRRRRKVYFLTDSGRQRAYSLREQLKEETVTVRDAHGTREATIGEVLRESRGQLTIIDVLRQVVHADFVDIVHLEPPGEEVFVQSIGEAPKVEDFLGREKELALLTQEAPLPRLFVVQGVAGIGKSSLGAKVCEHYRASSHIFWHRVRPWDTPQSVLAGLARFLNAMGKPALQSTVEGEHPELAPSVFQETLPGIHALIVLDDAHEAGPDLVPFLRFLKDAVSEALDVRVLVLTRRGVPFYDRRDVILEGFVGELALERLDEEDVRASLPASQDDALIAELARHPLFLRLLLAAPEQARSLGAKRDIHRFIEEAIYVELTEEERNLMKLASLYRVPVSARALFHDPRASYDILMALVGRSLVSRVGDEEFVVHDSIRDFFASVMTDAEQSSLQSYAVGQLLQHAKEAEERGDLTQRVDFLSNALTLAPQGSEWVSVCEALGDAQEGIGDFDGSVERYREALKSATERDAATRLRRKIGSIYMLQGETNQASAELETGFRTAGQAVNEEVGKLNLARCRLAIRLEEWEEAIEYGQVALNIFRSSDNALGQGQALYQLAHIENNRPGGKPVRAQQHLERALALTDEVDDLDFVANVHGTLAELFVVRLGKTREAQAHLEAIEALYDSSVDSYGRANFLMLKGMITLWQEADFPLAEALLVEARALASKFQARALAAYANYGLALAAYYQGDFEEARVGFEDFAGNIVEQGILSSAVESMCEAAECCLLTENLQHFHQLVGAVTDPKLARGAEARPLQVNVLLGTQAFLEGREGDAHTHFEEAMADARENHVGESLPFVVYGVVLQVMGREDEATKHVERGTSILEAYSRKAALAVLPKRLRRLREVFESTAHRGVTSSREGTLGAASPDGNRRR